MISGYIGMSAHICRKTLDFMTRDIHMHIYVYICIYIYTYIIIYLFMYMELTNKQWLQQILDGDL